MSPRKALGILLVLATSCSKTVGTHTAESPREFSAGSNAPVSLAPLEWLSKASLRLRSGLPLTAQDDLARLQSIPREQVVREWMSTPDFIDSLLGFNLYYFGQAVSSPVLQRREVGGALIKRYTSSVFDNPRIVSSAQAMQAQGDFWKALFGTQTRMTIPITGKPSDYLQTGHTNWRKIREAIGQDSHRRIDEIIELLEKMPDSEYDPSKSCYGHVLGAVLSPAGNLGMGVFVNLFTGPIFAECQLQKIRTDAIVWWKSLHARVDDFVQMANAHDMNVYAIQSPRDIRWLNHPHMKSDPEDLYFGQRYWFVTPNSSTNFNRKRAATILQRFFCDNLTPIGVVLPETHSQGRHASEPACFACHYKLDPMAGFFRYNGVVGISFEGQASIYFDDGAEMPLQPYVDHWRGTNPQVPWNIGYVRSSQNPALNDYAMDMNGLFGILERAPEVKACFVRKLAEYYVGKDQLFDPGYLEELTRGFTSRLAQNSSEAVRWTIEQLVLSQTFSQRDPHPERCYDLPSGTNPQDRPPCRVAAILQKNCVNCHRSTSGSGRIDLSRWDQKTRTFPHHNAQGQQIDRPLTLQTLIDVLSTSDPQRAMPLGIHMPAQDREALFLWVQSEKSMRVSR